MISVQPAPQPPTPATLDDLLAAEAAGRKVELIQGALVEKAMPTWQHGDAQTELAGRLREGTRPRRGQPGGWRVVVEMDIRFGGQVLRPDVSAWRAERAPRAEREAAVVDIVPDWVCEVLSPSTALRDLGEKRAIYWQHRVEHYWIVDPERRYLTVLGWQPSGYVILAVVGAGETVALAPFEDVAVDLGELFGEEPGV